MPDFPNSTKTFSWKPPVRNAMERNLTLTCKSGPHRVDYELNLTEQEYEEVMNNGTLGFAINFFLSFIDNPTEREHYRSEIHGFLRENGFQ
ncbi:MAG: hypothetical protein AAB966_00320 [Patescibacteria group bacterium]